MKVKETYVKKPYKTNNNNTAKRLMHLSRHSKIIYPLEDQQHLLFSTAVCLSHSPNFGIISINSLLIECHTALN